MPRSCPTTRSTEPSADLRELRRGAARDVGHFVAEVAAKMGWKESRLAKQAFGAHRHLSPLEDLAPRDGERVLETPPRRCDVAAEWRQFVVRHRTIIARLRDDPRQIRPSANNCYLTAASCPCSPIRRLGRNRRRRMAEHCWGSNEVAWSHLAISRVMKWLHRAEGRSLRHARAAKIPVAGAGQRRRQAEVSMRNDDTWMCHRRWPHRDMTR